MCPQVVDFLDWKKLEIISPYFIYKHTNKINGKCYIGRTKNGLKRFYSKCHTLSQNKSGCTALQNAINKYGFDNFTTEILCYVESENELADLEVYYIKKWNSLTPHGYNIKLGDKFVKMEDVAYEQKLSTYDLYTEIHEDKINKWAKERLDMDTGIENVYMHYHKLEFEICDNEGNPSVSIYVSSFKRLKEIILNSMKLPFKINDYTAYEQFMDYLFKRGKI